MLGCKLGVCLKTLVAKEGVSSLFKGVYSPLYSVPFINALVFGVYEMSRRVLCGSSHAQMNLAQGTWDLGGLIYLMFPRYCCWMFSWKY